MTLFLIWIWNCLTELCCSNINIQKWVMDSHQIHRKSACCLWKSLAENYADCVYNNRITNETIRQRIQQVPVSNRIRRMWEKWLGHMDERQQTDQKCTNSTHSVLCAQYTQHTVCTVHTPCVLCTRVCGSTHTRGYTRPDPYPRVRVQLGRCLTGRVGYDVHGYGYTRFYPQGTRFFKILERELFFISACFLNSLWWSTCSTVCENSILLGGYIHLLNYFFSF